MNTPVHFKTARILREKNFLAYCKSGYTEKGDTYFHQGGQEPVRNGEGYYEGRTYKGGEFYCSAPTISEVVEWLFETHSIYIHVSPIGDDTTLFKECKWLCTIYKDKVYNLLAGSKVTKGMEEFDSKAAAYEAAIYYCLTLLL